jgi:benzoyl-CoA reductase/2-hydroxyglutaryl-CoA dehydratase subunit BcrC/BadD/HgdB
VVKWYEAVAEQLDVPLYVLDTPFLHGDFSEQVQRYVLVQIREMIQFLHRTTGHELRPERLQEVIHLSNEAVELWGEIRALCKAHPSPLNAPDLFVNMAPIVVLRGERSAVRFYQHLKAEVEERVRDGISAIPEERYRLLWDNIAIWHHLYRFYNYFVDYGACFVADTYTGGWAHTVASGDPLAGLAASYATVFLNQSLEHRLDLMVQLASQYDVDGFVMHSNRSCKPYSLGQYALKRALAERTGLPGLVVESDMCDSRSYAREAVRTRVQAFMETVSAVSGPDAFGSGQCPALAEVS